MAAIIEDYVNFEIAKLLKEKGFDEYCRAEWLEYIDGPSKGKTYLTECGSGLQHNGCSNTSLKKFNYDGQMFYAAPTLQMAMKWLREVHNIIISIHPNDFKSNGIACYKADIWIKDKYVYEYEYNKEGNYDYTDREKKTFEESVEDAIKYCLENLI